MGPAPQALPHHRGLAAAGAARSAAWSTTTVGPAPSGTGPTQPSGLFVVARLSLAVLMVRSYRSSAVRSPVMTCSTAANEYPFAARNLR